LKENAISWIRNLENFDFLSVPSNYNLTIVCDKINVQDIKGYNLILSDNSRSVFFEILKKFFYKENKYKISKNAIVETKNVGNNVNIGNGSFICESVKIDDNVYIGNNVSIESPCIIGKDTHIYSGVVIGVKGNNFYEINNTLKLVPKFGGIVIGSNVTIGANTFIGRGILDDTIIENNSKIGMNVVIAHDNKIGENCKITCGSSLCGYVSVCKDSYIAAGSVVSNRVKIGEHCMLGMGTVLKNDLPSGYVASGNPEKRIKMDYNKLLKKSACLNFKIL
jgi:UDP-3-O-[3-hydroxymyristoyl] glucosamine N-acyltransferase